MIKNYNIISGCYSKAEHFINLASNSLSIFDESKEKEILKTNNIQNIVKNQEKPAEIKGVLPQADTLFKEYENDLEHVKKLGTIYMKRMLENNDIKLLHELFYSNKISKKYTNHIQKLKTKLEKLISQNKKTNNNLSINVQSLLK